MKWTLSPLGTQLCARTHLTRQREVHTHRGRGGNFTLIVNNVLTGSCSAKLQIVCSQLEQIYIELSIFKNKSQYWFLNKTDYSNVICRILVYYFTLSRDLTLTLSLKHMVPSKKPTYYVSFHILTCNTYFFQAIQNSINLVHPILKDFCYATFMPKQITHVLQKSSITT